MEKRGKIESFEDLIVWKKAHALTIEIYTLTETFPKEEIFGLTSQMRRAAVSIVSNIVEGFSRKTGKDKLQFYLISKGSLTELQSQLYIACDLGYLSEKNKEKILENMTIIGKLITGLQKSTKNYMS